MLSIDFPDREYELGGRIDVRIMLTPEREVRLRSARVDLVCNQTYTQHSAWEGSAPATITRARTGASTSALLDYSGGMKVDQRTESYVHSTVMTLGDALFREGVTETHRVDLRIDPSPPRRWNQAIEAERNASAAWSFAWKLSVSLDIARGRDIKVERDVRITLPPLPAETSSSKPSMSRPKRPTG